MLSSHDIILRLRDKKVKVLGPDVPNADKYVGEVGDFAGTWTYPSGAVHVKVEFPRRRSIYTPFSNVEIVQ
jgi:hypothetical protein